MSELNRSVDLRCSTITRTEGIDPIGTAGYYDGFLIIEVPPPWPHDVSEIGGLEQVATQANARNIRVQAAVPCGDAPPSVALYTWRPDLGRYVGTEAPMGSDPARTALAFLGNESIPGVRPVEVIDVLVCGHGRRDRCCGRLGAALEVKVRSAEMFNGGRVRLRRTSHLGGHRFAPTALLLGEGTCWAYLDSQSLVDVLARRSAVRNYLRHYRGCTGLPSAGLQALERAVLEEEGWDLFNRARHGSVLDDGRFALDVEYPGDIKRRWVARVVTTRTVAVPKCGVAKTGEEKTEPELAVVDLLEMR